ncbi:MAG: hypothetical protein AAGI66_03090 [Cyanobacteria bacterium P01_H01_bin.74]
MKQKNRLHPPKKHKQVALLTTAVLLLGLVFPVKSAQKAEGPVVFSAFEQSNPDYGVGLTGKSPTQCSALSNLPANEADKTLKPSSLQSLLQSLNGLPIDSYSSNVSSRSGAVFLTSPRFKETSDFHIQSKGGNAKLKLNGISRYSVCLARGNNLVAIGNASYGSVFSYAGNDFVSLTDQITNTVINTGDEDDTISIELAKKVETGQKNPLSSRSTKANTLYRVVLSGGPGDDLLVLHHAPPGSQWQVTGQFSSNGEQFYQIEIRHAGALKSQRMDIGTSIEKIEFYGKTYMAKDFLTQGLSKN